jgi:hypothetical protein
VDCSLCAPPATLNEGRIKAEIFVGNDFLYNLCELSWKISSNMGGSFSGQIPIATTFLSALKLIDPDFLF